MAWKLAELFVSITGDDKPLSNTLAGVHRRLGIAGAAVARSMTVGAGLAGAGLAAGLGVGIKKAVELQDTMSRNAVIFGDSARLINAEADRMAERFGALKGDYLDAAGNFGAMFKGAGAGQRDAALLGNQLTKLAYDMASFKGGTTSATDTLGALAAALRGEFDPAEQFGIFLTADAVAAHAVASGLARSKTEISDYAKKQATLALILKQTTDQQGDLERTSGQTKNQFDLLVGSLTNFATTIGEEILPTVNEWLVVINGGLKPALESAGFFVRNFGDIWELAQLGISEQVAKILGWVGVIPANLMSFASWLQSNWLTLCVDAFGGFVSVVENAWTNIRDLFNAGWDFLQGGGWEFQMTPLLDGFEAVTKELPEMIVPPMLEGFDEARQKILDRIAGGEMKRAEDKAAAAAELAGAKVEGGGQAAAKAKGAKTELVGADQFWKDLLGGDKTAKESLAVQKDQLGVQQDQRQAIVDLAKELKKPRPAVAGA